MSLRASKASQDPAPPTVGTSSDAPPQADRIYVDNSNIAELKSTCDDAVERVRAWLMRFSKSRQLPH